MEKPKPCSCGNTDIRVLRDSFRESPIGYPPLFYCYCDACHSRGPTSLGEYAIEAWNQELDGKKEYDGLIVFDD